MQLISVSMLNKDLHCSTIFSTDSCVLQDLASGRTIGIVDCSEGLYLLKMKSFSQSSSSSSSSPPIYVFQSNKDSGILLWHYRLGHPNFVHLKKMFLSLSINKTLHFPRCDVWRLWKHTRNSFKPQPYTPAKHFALIHSDIWGPSCVKNITSTHWFLLFVNDHIRVLDISHER